MLLQYWLENIDSKAPPKQNAADLRRIVPTPSEVKNTVIKFVEDKVSNNHPVDVDIINDDEQDLCEVVGMTQPKIKIPPKKKKYKKDTATSSKAKKQHKKAIAVKVDAPSQKGKAQEKKTKPRKGASIVDSKVLKNEARENVASVLDTDDIEYEHDVTRFNTYMEFYQEDDISGQVFPRPFISNGYKMITYKNKNKEVKYIITLENGKDIRVVSRTKHEFNTGQNLHKILNEIQLFVTTPDRTQYKYSYRDQSQFCRLDRLKYLGRRIACLDGDPLVIKWGTVVSIEEPTDQNLFSEVKHGICFDYCNDTFGFKIDSITWQQSHCYFYNAEKFNELPEFSCMDKRGSINFSDLDNPCKRWIRDNLLPPQGKKTLFDKQTGTLSCGKYHSCTRTCRIDGTINPWNFIDAEDGVAEMVPCEDLDQWEYPEEENSAGLGLGGYNCFLSLDGVCALLFDGSESTKSVYVKDNHYTPEYIEGELVKLNKKRRKKDNFEPFVHPIMYARKADYLLHKHKLNGKFLFFCGKCTKETNAVEEDKMSVACYKCIEYVEQKKGRKELLKTLKYATETNVEYSKRSEEVHKEERSERIRKRSKASGKKVVEKKKKTTKKRKTG